MDKDDLVVLGAGGHARALLSLAELNQLRVTALIDKNAGDNEIIMGKPVFPNTEFLDNSSSFSAVVGVGDNLVRKKQLDEFREFIVPRALKHPSAILDPTAQVGYFCQIFAGTFIGPMANISDNVIINTHAVIEHEARIGSHSHISVGAKVLGRANIGDLCFIGAGAVIKDGIRVCSNVTIGANSFVNKNIDVPGVYVGTPVRKVDDK